MFIWHKKKEKEKKNSVNKKLQTKFLNFNNKIGRIEKQSVSKSIIQSTLKEEMHTIEA